ncbi:MAG: phosphoribosylformylglycinamidine cyclo-ligase [Myxococcota bacterium]|nr:phosphoribosylformylglycinamidine cyclo-ligase [Myxococcota bacterium]
MTEKEISYRSSGVDIEAGDRFAAGLAGIAGRTMRPEVIAGIGGFAGLFRPELSGMSEPVLVSGTDGVGTKLMIAQRANRHDSIGIDLVAMCVNDVLTIGAEPLFFLDYFATGKLDEHVGNTVIQGIVAGCEDAGCALLGGETAEMPGMYPDGKYDLAGFCVGMVDRSKMIDGSAINTGDAIIGLASNGLHSNGYSLARSVFFEHAALDLSATLEELSHPLVDELLAPTRIYAKATSALRDLPIHGFAHITGGGIAGNLVRVLPASAHAKLDPKSWPEPPVFRALRRFGVPDSEMRLTFNLGLGLIAILPQSAVGTALKLLSAAGYPAWQIGEVVKGERGVSL